MSKLLTIEFTWDTHGTVFPKYTWRSHLTTDEKIKFKAYSVIALLLQQLCVQSRIYGLKTVEGVYQSISGNFEPKPIHTDLVGAKVELLVSGAATTATFHPKIRFFGTHAEDGASALVQNFSKRILKEGVNPYTDLLKVSLLSILIAYHKVTVMPENYFPPSGGDHKLAPGVQRAFQYHNLTFYNEHWAKTPALEIDEEGFQKLMDDYAWRLGGKIPPKSGDPSN